MRHLIVCPEFPPAPMPPGGIGTYVVHLSRLMAEAGETVHVLGPQWEGAPRAREERIGGRLIVHRVPVDRPVHAPAPAAGNGRFRGRARGLPDGRLQRFSLHAAEKIEAIVREEGVDVIEAQEYDAPLYVHQLRRALGLGRDASPPCIVQLHSPSELIFRHNEWDMTSEDFLQAKRMEAFSIGTADALLCPSRYLARRAEAHYGLPEGTIEVLRLPIGDTPVQERPDAVWESATICYVGRLEPRKGVIEWVQAAVRTAHRYPEARFEFYGANVQYHEGSTVREHLLSLIPRRLRRRFVFHGSRPREEVIAALGRSCAAVIPSRWENFPNTCIEAMCTGTPVIASPEGGMAEMIEDGRSGWIAPGADAAALAKALVRALETPAAQRAAMGRAASRRIRVLCDNDATLSEHLEFRERVARAGAERSLRLPTTLPWIRRRLDDRSAVRRATAAPGPPGVVVTCRADGTLLDGCLEALRLGALPEEAGVVVVDVAHDRSVPEAVDRARLNGWHVVHARPAGPGAVAAMRNVGARELLERVPALGALLFLDERDRPGEGLLERAHGVLLGRPSVGVVSPWTLDAETRRVVGGASPAFPYQLISDDSAPASLFRLEALREIGLLDERLPDGYDRWDAVSRIMERGWAAVALPELLAVRRGAPRALEETGPAHRRLREFMLDAVPEAVQRDARELVLLLEDRGLRPGTSTGAPLTPLGVLRKPVTEQLRIVGKAARNPGHAARWLGWHGRIFVKRGTTRLRAAGGDGRE